MTTTQTGLFKRLGLGASALALGLLLAACSDDSKTEKKAEPLATETAQTDSKPADAAKTEAKPADAATTEAKPAELKIPEPAGTVDVAKLMAPGALPDMTIGKADAKVTIVEYMSMTCPHCARFHNDIFEKIKEKYVDTGTARFILREFPLDTRAAAAIMLARCAPNGQYFPMVSALFKSQMTWATAEDGRAALMQMSKLAGFTQESFEACLTNQKLLDDVNKVREAASKDFGVDSTPTFFINGNRYAGEMSVEEMSAVIDAAAQ